MTKLIAMSVRNAMEDFHCKHLTDEQMAELNPIIRNGIYTALTAITVDDKDYLNFNSRMIPSYWEDAKLLDEIKTRDIEEER